MYPGQNLSSAQKEDIWGKATEKVIRVESEIEYRRDMPDSKTEVPAREEVGKKKKKEEEKERQNEVEEEEEPEVDTDSLVQVCVYPHLDY